MSFSVNPNEALEMLAQHSAHLASSGGAVTSIERLGELGAEDLADLCLAAEIAIQ